MQNIDNTLSESGHLFAVDNDVKGRTGNDQRAGAGRGDFVRSRRLDSGLIRPTTTGTLETPTATLMAKRRGANNMLVAPRSPAMAVLV